MRLNLYARGFGWDMAYLVLYTTHNFLCNRNEWDGEKKRDRSRKTRHFMYLAIHVIMHLFEVVKRKKNTRQKREAEGEKKHKSSFSSSCIFQLLFFGCSFEWIACVLLQLVFLRSSQSNASVSHTYEWIEVAWASNVSDRKCLFEWVKFAFFSSIKRYLFRY